MAKLVAYKQYDILSVDLSWYYYNSFYKTLSIDLSPDFNSVPYKDFYYVYSRDLYDELELYFAGSGMTLDAGRLSTGTVNFVAEADYITGDLLWYAEGLSISAPALYDAATTLSTSDEFNLIVSALSGDDTIILSPFADRMSGFAGNDILTGGLGQDWLEGGSGNDTFRDDMAGLNGDTIADLQVGDRIVFTDASLSNFQASLNGNLLSFGGSLTGFSLTLGGLADGKLVVRSAAEGGVELILSNADTQFAKPGAVLVSNFSLGAGGWSSQDRYPRHVADMNGDGYGDIVGFGEAGVLVSYGSASGTFSAPGLVVANFGQASGWTSDNQFHRELADLNGDGRADIVGFGIAGTWVSLAQANGSFSAPAIGITNFGANQGWTSQEGFARTVGDVNGDGKADIVGFGYAGAWLSLGKGDGTFADPKLAVGNFGVQQGWASDNQFHRAVGDIDGDGFDDIVGFGIAGTWAALSNGDGTFGQVYFAADNLGKAQGWSSQDAFSRHVADVDGDDIADLVGFGIAGTWIGYGKGDGTFSAVSRDVDAFAANQGWTSNNSYHRELADLNGDGLNDIVGFGQAGVYAGYNQGDWFV